MNSRGPTKIFYIALAVYLVAATFVLISLLRLGSVLGAVIGVVLVAIPLMGFVLVWKDIALRRGVERMTSALGSERALVGSTGAVPGAGEPIPAAAESIEKPDPGDWRSWYTLAGTYETDDDHKRARAAMRHALSIFEK